MINLLRLVTDDALQARATPSSPTVAQQLMHVHHERLISVTEEAAEYAVAVPATEWAVETDRDRIAQHLLESARVVRQAVAGRIVSGRQLDLHYDHPLLMLQLLLWHEAYHHGQIKLALKLGGMAISDEVAGPATWGVWRRRGADALRPPPK
jgi:hypothetical protein